MTHAAIEAMARALLMSRNADMGAATCFHFVEDVKANGGAEWRGALRDALAALRALAACEPSEAELRAGTDAFWADADIVELRRAMLAELVKECERDA